MTAEEQESIDDDQGEDFWDRYWRFWAYASLASVGATCW